MKPSQKTDFGSPQKARDLRQVKAAARFKPEEYIKYFEDLIRSPNAEIGLISLRSSSYARQEDFFEIASCHPLPF
jgi:hypothetical protein